MILFKACPRCGGDVDATHRDDVYCVQCGHRPAGAFPGPRILESASEEYRMKEDITVPDWLRQAEGIAAGRPPCPSCGSVKAVQLDRVRPQDNTCYRCRWCGHIFSPGTDETDRPTEALP